MNICTMTKREILAEMRSHIAAIPALAIGARIFDTDFRRTDDSDSWGQRRLAGYISDNKELYEVAKTMPERCLRGARQCGNTLLFSEHLQRPDYRPDSGNWGE